MIWRISETRVKLIEKDIAKVTNLKGCIIALEIRFTKAIKMETFSKHISGNFNSKFKNDKRYVYIYYTNK